MINESDYKPEVLEQLRQPWTIEIRPYNDGGYFARVVELRGCMTEGDSQLEALQLLEEAQAEWLAAALEHGDPIPKPQGDSEYSGKIFVRTSPHLHRMVSEAAFREGVSMSQWIGEVLSRAVSFQEARLWFTHSDWLNDIFRAMNKRPEGSVDLIASSDDGTASLVESKTLKDVRTVSYGRRSAMGHQSGKGKDVHVTPREGGKWAVKKAGSQRASSVHENKTDAVSKARATARVEKSELVVHNKDGKISGQKDSHGHDPRRSKG